MRWRISARPGGEKTSNLIGFDHWGLWPHSRGGRGDGEGALKAWQDLSREIPFAWPKFLASRPRVHFPMNGKQHRVQIKPTAGSSHPLWSGF